MLARTARSALLALLAFTFASTSPAAARAQSTSELETEDTRARRAEATQRAAREAAEEAALFVPLAPDQRVTYAEVLARPDDIELGFRFAQTQIVDGDLPGAAATLHRILLIQPGYARVRLLYGIVLLRLGSLAEAERVLGQVESTGPADARIQASKYRERIERMRRRTHYSLSLSAGTQYDSNRNSGPNSNQVLLGDTRFDLGGGSKKTADGGWFSLAELRVEHDLATQEDRRLTAGVAYFHSQQQDLPSFDVQALKLDAGLRLRRAGGELTPRIVVDVIDLSRENYLRSVGVELTGSRPLSARADLHGTARLTHEDLDGIPEAPTASSRSGYRAVLGAEASLRPTPRQKLALGLELTRKSANDTAQAYWGYELDASHLMILSRGQFVLTSLGIAREKYKHADTTVSDSRRRVLRSRARLVYGLPLGALLPSGGFTSLADVVLSVNGEIVLARSNIPNFDYRNRKLGVTVSKRLEF